MHAPTIVRDLPVKATISCVSLVPCSIGYSHQRVRHTLVPVSVPQHRRVIPQHQAELTDLSISGTTWLDSVGINSSKQHQKDT